MRRASTGRSSRTSPTASGCRWTTSRPSEIFDELVSLMPNYANLNYDNLGPTGQALPEPRPGDVGRHGRALRGRVQHRRRAGAPGARRVDAGARAARRGVPVRAEHRPAARALAHRLDDPPLVRARRDLARRRSCSSTRPTPSGWGSPTGTSRASTSRRGSIELEVRGLAPRDAGQLLHPLPLPRGGREPAHHRRDRPVRQDPRVQVLRRAGRSRPRCPAADRGRSD